MPDRFDILPCAIALCDAEGCILSANAMLRDWVGRSAEDLIGRPFHSLLAPAGRIYFETHLRPLVMVEGAFSEVSLELAGPVGQRRPIYLNGRLAEDGSIAFAFFDGAQRRSYEQELLTKRRAAEAFGAILSASPDAIVQTGADGLVRHWNGAAERLLGWAATEITGRPAREAIVPEERGPELEMLKAALAADGMARIETERLHRSGTRVPVELSVAPLCDEAGRQAGEVTVLRDLRQVQRDAEMIRTLNGEVLHRAKNLLGVVKATMRLTARSSDPATFVQDFGRRLDAMASVQSLLVQRRQASLDLEALCRVQLAPLVDPEDPSIEIAGPPLPLRPSVAEALGMALFELGTNALKHGALAQPDGRLRVAWSVGDGAEPRVVLDWTESGLSNVVPPSRTGFGSRVTGFSVETVTRGKVKRDFRPSGLVWRLDAPHAALIPENTSG